MKIYVLDNQRKCVYFSFLDTFIIAYRLYRSNPKGQEAIEALTVCSRWLLTSSSLLKKKKKEKKSKVIGEEGDEISKVKIIDVVVGSVKQNKKIEVK